MVSRRIVSHLDYFAERRAVEGAVVLEHIIRSPVWARRAPILVARSPICQSTPHRRVGDAYWHVSGWLVISSDALHDAAGGMPVIFFDASTLLFNAILTGNYILVAIANFDACVSPRVVGRDLFVTSYLNQLPASGKAHDDAASNYGADDGLDAAGPYRVLTVFRRAISLFSA